MGALRVALTLNVEHDAAMQQVVEHGGAYHRIVEDPPPDPTPRFVVMTMELFT
jgi:hypothetical protein